MSLGNFSKTIFTGLLGAFIGASVTYWLTRPVPLPPPPAPEPVARLPQAEYRPVDFTDLPGWTDDTLNEALPALKKSCEAIDPTAAPARLGARTITADEKRTACEAVLKSPSDLSSIRKAFETAYQPLAVGDGEDAEGTFTGYYEASLNGALARGGKYQTPLYGPPRNLVSVNLKDFTPPGTLPDIGVPANIVGRVVGRELKPYFTRTEIDDQNAIAADSDVIAWIDDPVDAHVLHIQGSGQVTLPDGKIMRVGFAGHNGHKFKGIGGILLEEGVLKPGRASMAAVRDWLKKNPKRARDLMNRNARYIFFRKIEGDGPIGASGVALTPGRSLAVDPRFVSLGLPVWLATADPDGKPLRRLVMAQDVGAAITGAVRGDFFWGAGEAAFAQAARMKSRGRYFVLAPKTLESPP